MDPYTLNSKPYKSLIEPLTGSLKGALFGVHGPLGFWCSGKLKRLKPGQRCQSLECLGCSDRLRAPKGSKYHYGIYL